MIRSIALIVILFAAFTAAISAQQSADWATNIGSHYWVQADVVYNTANKTPLKLDIWYRHEQTDDQPTLVYFHGGGWIFGEKAYSLLYYLPFLEKGWRVVDVEYRMASNSLAPAAVEDTRCALRWIFRNAKQWKFNNKKIVLMGHSAGGHLSLITGMLPEGTPLDNACYGDEKLEVAAIINWYGIADVNDLMDGPNTKNYAKMWMGSQPNAAEIAKSVSPLSYVRPGLPPIISIHGDKDGVVPYSHSVRLTEALNAAKVTNKLVTIKDGGHGQFTDKDTASAYQEIWKFLKDNGIQK